MPVVAIHLGGHRRESESRRRERSARAQKAWQKTSPTLVRCATTSTALLALTFALSNILQSIVLASAKSSRGIRDDSLGLIAVRGVPKPPAEELKNDFGEDCLYIEEGYINTLDPPERYCIPFKIDGIEIDNAPTEVYGLEVRYRTRKRSNLTWRHAFIPTNEFLTVFGRLTRTEVGYRLTCDPYFGLIISRQRLQMTILQEAGKGFGALALAWFFAFRVCAFLGLPC